MSPSMEKYREVLSQSDVDEAKQIWYVRWVDRFQRELKFSDATADLESVLSFVDSVKDREDSDDWQVFQCAKALKLW